MNNWLPSLRPSINLQTDDAELRPCIKQCDQVRIRARLFYVAIKSACLCSVQQANSPALQSVCLHLLSLRCFFPEGEMWIWWLSWISMSPSFLCSLCRNHLNRPEAYRSSGVDAPWSFELKPWTHVVSAAALLMGRREEISPLWWRSTHSCSDKAASSVDLRWYLVSPNQSCCSRNKFSSFLSSLQEENRTDIVYFVFYLISFSPQC